MTFLVASWGLNKGSKRAFRPAMALSTGELSGLGGSILIMTATATPKIQRVLQNQFPEIGKWKTLLNLPLRQNVTVIVPPTELISSKVEITLAPFILDMKQNPRIYLIIVRGINKGALIFLHLLKMLMDPSSEERQIAFYHRNTSEERKEEILRDLKLPLNSIEKKLRCVVATVSLGVGVDVRVHNTVVFGLSATVEDFIQEGGRSMRGSELETQGQRGLSFFFHKGLIEAKHCPVISEVRELISKPPPVCQTKIILLQFERDFAFDTVKCTCCYSCIKSHSELGCKECLLFLETFLPTSQNLKIGRSVLSELKSALNELFSALDLSSLKVEDNLEIGCKEFIADLVKVLDEVKSPSDIVRFWHVNFELAFKVFSVINTVLYGSDSEEPEEEDINSDDDNDTSNDEDYTSTSSEDE